jgi:hypothetical protein
MNEADEIQRHWARLVGLSYVLALAPAVFAEFYVGGLVSGNAVVTAQNIIAHERLYRIGIAANLLAFAIDVLLVTSLYVVLERVNRRLALLAAFFRLMETLILIVAVLNDFYVLRLLGAGNYASAVDPSVLAALARASIGAHGSACQSSGRVPIVATLATITISHSAPAIRAVRRGDVSVAVCRSIL